jgi:hypothetical protein
LLWLDDCLENNPRNCDAVQVNNADLYGDAEMWVYQSPTITGMHVVRVLYEVQEEPHIVLYWHIQASLIPDYGVL